MISNRLLGSRLLSVKLICIEPRLSFFKMAAPQPNCYVRFIEDNPAVQLSFVYSDETIKERRFNLNRSKDEELSVAFTRILANIQNISDRKSKLKKKLVTDVAPEGASASSNTKDDLKITLHNGETIVPVNTKNIDAWVDGNILTIGAYSYKVLINFPTVLSLALPKSIMAGFPVYPKVKLEFANEMDCLYVWYRKIFKKSFPKIDDSKVVQCHNNQYLLKLGDGYYYYPSNDDIGQHLKVYCEPRSPENRIGMTVDAESPKIVEAGPGICPFDERHLYTELFAPFGSFRCITYNILADLYADSKFSRETLFPYCPEYALDIEYRKQLLFKEIIGYKGDLIFLQEVDKKIFEYDLQPLLQRTGLEGIFNLKGGQVAEGLATFYRPGKFRLIESEVIILSNALENNPQLTNFYETICKNKRLKERVLARTTAMQVVLFESAEDPSRLLLSANVHLYFHPDADHIRLFQASLCLRILENKLNEQKLKNPDKTCILMLSGDFNSCVENGVYQLMTTGSVDEDSNEWKSNPDEAIVDFKVSHSQSLGSACGCPEYTNFTLGFNGCLDYIYYDKSQLEVTDIVPLPSHEIVTRFTALPNSVFPSDHLALVCTLKWI